MIAEHSIGYVVIDSAGLCGEDVASASDSYLSFNTLRKVTASTGPPARY